MLHYGESATFAAEYRGLGYSHVGQRDVCVVGGHIERPQVFLDTETWCVRWYEERGDTRGVARIARGAGEDEVGVGDVYAGVPGLFAVEHPVGAVADGAGCHVG